MDLVDPNEYLTKLPAAMEPIRHQFNITGIQELYETVDLIGEGGGWRVWGEGGVFVWWGRGGWEGVYVCGGVLLGWTSSVRGPWCVCVGGGGG
jgi:hypothetical protein